MNVLPSVTPKVTIETDQWNEGTTTQNTCESKEIVFRANLIPKDPAVYNHIYQWHVNDVMVEGATSETFSILPEDDGVKKVHLVTHSYGGCLTTDYAKSGSISFRSPAPPPPAPTLVSTCGQTYLRATLVAGRLAYWQSTPNGTSTAYNGSSNYTVTQPGTYYLRSYSSTCWGGEQKIEVLPAHTTPKPVFDAQPRCNDISLAPTAGVRPGDQLYFQSSATSTETNKPFTDKITSAGTYYVKGRDASGNWGCTSDPVVISQIPQGVSCNRNFVRERVVQQDGITSSSQITAANAITSYSYFDGLGRPMQTVAVGASPDGKDLVTPVEYDSFGREAIKYLPYESTTNNGSYKANALGASTVTDSQRKWYSTAHTGIPSDTRPFSETIFEPSPLNRVTEQYGPGAAWYTANPKKGGQIKYNTNIANDVRLWKATEAVVKLDNPAYYPAGTLYATESIDEDGRTVIEYKDLQDRVVRRKQKGEDNSKDAITDYAYDDFGRLAYVLPPAIYQMKRASIPVGTHDSTIFRRYVYAYRYDARGRVVEKHIPGAGWTWIVYNKLDQPILTQDAVQRGTGQWSYTKYDAHGRVAVTGLYSGTENATQADIQALADGTTYDQWESRPPGSDYTNKAFPNAATVTHTINFYDNYNFPGNPFSGTSDRPHGLPTGSKVKVLDSTPEVWLYSVTYYDQKGRVKLTRSEQLTADDDKATDQTAFEYDFTGRITRTERKISTVQ